MEFSLLGAVVIAVLAVYAALRWDARRSNAADCTSDLWDIALGGVVAGVAVGRLAAMVGDGVNPFTNPGDIVIVRAGVATGPAALAALAWAAWVGRKEVVAVADGLATAALAGLMGWHASCLVRDACLGLPSTLPWAYSQPGSSITRHPVELYASLAFLAFGVGLAVWRTRRRVPGLPAGVALLAAGAVRWSTEPLRPALGSGPVLWYAAGVIAGGLVVIAAVRNGARRRAGIEELPGGRRPTDASA